MARGGFRASAASLLDSLRALVRVGDRNDGMLVPALREAKSVKLGHLLPDDLLAQMSHEMRTPVSGIIGMMELALQSPLSVDQRECLNIARASAGALLTTVNEVLDYSKIEAGRMDIERVSFSLQDCIHDAVRSLALEAERKGLELACDVAADLPLLSAGDPARLRQVLVNLVGNAIKFTERGHVLVEAVKAADADVSVTCEITVRDTGIGIAPNQRQTIFEPYEQGGVATGRQYGGTGLGLAITARLVQMMGGGIRVDSTPGKGSDFCFTVPLGLPDGCGVPVAALPDPLLNPRRGLRVLLAQPQAVTRRTLVRMLRAWAVAVDDVGDIAGLKKSLARACRTAQPYDLLLLDEQMSQADTALLGRLQATAGVAAVVVLASITGRMQRGMNGQAASDRVETIYLTKPVKPSELLAVLAAPMQPPSVVTTPVLETPVLAVPQDRALDVLLVEDDPINRRVAEHVLVAAGCHVVSAGNGRAALDRLERGGIDLVLMDIQLPDMDGLEITRAIRRREIESGVSHSGQRGLPIVALTAHVLAEKHALCLEAGMDGVLVKPVGAAELNAVLGRLFASPLTVCAVLDRDALLGRIHGDLGLLTELAAMLQDHGSRLFADGSEALRGRDRHQLGYVAHTLVGMLRSLSATRALAVAERIEAEAGCGDWERLAAEHATLVKEVDRLGMALHALVAETAAPAAVPPAKPAVAARAGARSRRRVAAPA
jgi:signal transduction histidine kinase/DNA-binding response OmpR family regulator/HPt (histidine-containing phosphotransfer) domain-containing protein